MSVKRPPVADRFRALGVYNPYEFASRFGTKGVDDYIISYHAYEARTMNGHKTTVWAPNRKVDPDSHFLDYGAKAFHGGRKSSLPEALAWVKATFKLDDWVPCPVDRSSMVPRAVRDRGLAWLKAKEKTTDPTPDQPPAGGRR